MEEESFVLWGVGKEVRDCEHFRQRDMKLSIVSEDFSYLKV